MTTTKSPYVEKIEAEWDELKAKVRSKAADAKIWTHEKSAEWEGEKAEFEAKLQNWRGEDEGSEGVQDRVENAWGTLKTKWNNFVEDVRD